jgi:hypothetical protein
VNGICNCEDGKGRNNGGECEECRDGKYSNKYTNFVCSECLGNGIANDEKTGCVCNSGYEEDGSGGCKACSAGTYKDDYVNECTPCSSGTYSNTTGSTSCISCSAIGGMTGESDSTSGSTYCLCLNGYGGDGSGGCKVCSAGTYKDDDVNECTPCSSGTYSNTAGSTSCTTCGTGTTGSNIESGSTYCLCSDGYEENGSGGCTECPPGTYKDDDVNECTECLKGTYSNETGSGSCSTCETETAGSNIESGSTYCLCSNGYEENGSGGCNKCSAGTYKDRDVNKCTSCLEGTYSNETGSGSCSTCGTETAGSNIESGSTYCLCSEGYGGDGRGGCTLCYNGEYSLDGGSCLKCPEGTFLNGVGKSVEDCVRCPNGSFSNMSGSVTCNMCGLGSEANEERTGCICSNDYIMVDGKCDVINNCNERKEREGNGCGDGCVVMENGKGCGKECDNEAHYEVNEDGRCIEKRCSSRRPVIVEDGNGEEKEGNCGSGDCVYDNGVCKIICECEDGMVHVYNKSNICSSDICEGYSLEECGDDIEENCIIGKISDDNEEVSCHKRRCSDINVDNCEDVVGCAIIGGLCGDNTCGNLIKDKDECDEICVIKVVNDETECILDHCASFDEVNCKDHYLSRCDMDISAGICRTHKCSNFNTRY